MDLIKPAGEGGAGGFVSLVFTLAALRWKRTRGNPSGRAGVTFLEVYS